MASSSSSEIVHEGWLVKSPPTKPIWRAKWRRRWFVLKHSGELPGQYYLEYYTDNTYRKIKGKIDLDQCDQVDGGLRFKSRKQDYPNMFDIRTPKRIFYLAADTEEDMHKWVNCICQVCGLKAYSREDENGTCAEPLEPKTSQETPPTSPLSVASSGPYFPLSECLSGSRSMMFSLSSADGSSHQSPSPIPTLTFPSSAPVTPVPSRGSGFSGTAAGSQSLRNKPGVRREEWGLPYDQPRILSPLPFDTMRGLEEKHSTSFKRPPPPPIADSEEPKTSAAPPRPPKPAHLAEPNSHNYLNMEQLTPAKSAVKAPGPRSPSLSSGPNTPLNPEDWYDIPRSHQPEEKSGSDRRRHCYSNAAPGEISQAEVFTFPNNNHWPPPTTPTAYSNLHSPPPVMSPTLAPPTPAMTPPSVNRTLKPRKPAGSASAVGTGHRGPPSVNRQLKPHRSTHGGGKGKLESRLSSSDEGEHDPSSRNSSRPNSSHEDDQGYIFDMSRLGGASKRFEDIQYLDLDLESDGSIQSPKSPERVQQQQSSSTVYKTVDFVKTEAFNMTKKIVEECRYKKP